MAALPKRCMKGNMVNKWYVLDPNGETVTEVIVAGPYDTEVGYDGVNEIHLLDSTKVERHLAEDARLTKWLKERM